MGWVDVSRPYHPTSNNTGGLVKILIDDTGIDYMQRLMYNRTQTGVVQYLGAGL